MLNGCLKLGKKTNNNLVSSKTSIATTSQPELEEISILSPNHTYGSIELINGLSFNTEKYNEDDLHEEITELRKQVKNLNDDRYQLINQLNQSEDVNAQLQSTNQTCESRIQSLKLSLDNALSFRSSEPEEACLHDDKGQETAIRRINQLAEENADLQNQLDETRQQLHFALEDLNDEKKGHNFALEKLKADKEKIEEDLTDTIATTMMLEKQIEELKIENSNFRESQFFQKTPPISDLFQSSFDEYNDPFSVNQNADDNNEPIANSTPFVKRMSKIGVTRGSIGDELKGTGISKGLPLCEKSALLNDISAKPTETKDAEVQTTWLDYLTSVTNFYGGRQMAFGSFSVIFLAIFIFTFFGAIEFEDGEKWMPITWFSFLPEPFNLFKIRAAVPPAVW